MRPTDGKSAHRRGRLPRWAWIVGVTLGLLWAAVEGTAAPGTLDLGLSFTAGGRYDDLRMCVATPAGVKGGPMADVALLTRVRLDERLDLSFNLPVMRPLLFGAAFKMLQFEPFLELDIRHRLGERSALLLGPVLGASLHYGPDYRSQRTNRSPSFFAAGPLVGLFAGIGLQSAQGREQRLGVRPFYTALFSRDHGRGTVIGAALEYARIF